MSSVLQNHPQGLPAHPRLGDTSFVKQNSCFRSQGQNIEGSMHLQSMIKTSNDEMMASTKVGNGGTEAASNYEMMASRRASPNSGGHSVEQGKRGRTGDGNAPERQQCRVTTIPVSRVLGAG